MAVQALIADLGLGACAHPIVSNAFVCSVSGGERKRVSIGHELLVNPSLLVLDEPPPTPPPRPVSSARSRRCHARGARFAHTLIGPRARERCLAMGAIAAGAPRKVFGGGRGTTACAPQQGFGYTGSAAAGDRRQQGIAHEAEERIGGKADGATEF
ncbi:hypothetical protein QYE76_011758 [Lolium multiflorum]|uniref:ABC transporter domain-containing protein n=1 Tax=Lolium multiflorum TaxID=4521 RepID=A0AAD8TVZ4_LOLMU|nr:hypothetical protein QYE76_011758 [Lolium multiflorum]